MARERFSTDSSARSSSNCTSNEEKSQIPFEWLMPGQPEPDWAAGHQREPMAPRTKASPTASWLDQLPGAAGAETGPGGAGTPSCTDTGMCQPASIQMALSTKHDEGNCKLNYEVFSNHKSVSVEQLSWALSIAQVTNLRECSLHLRGIFLPCVYYFLFNWKHSAEPHNFHHLWKFTQCYRKGYYILDISMIQMCNKEEDKENRSWFIPSFILTFSTHLCKVLCSCLP